MLVVLQGDLGAGGGRELASADEITQCEDQLLELVCRRLEEVRWEQQEGLARWHQCLPCRQELVLNSRKASRAQGLATDRVAVEAA